MQALLQPELLLDLPLKDILSLCSTDREMRKACSSDDFWQLLSGLKFGPGLAESCAKENFIIKSFLRENIPTTVIRDALFNKDFAKARTMFKIGFPYDLNEIAFILTTNISQEHISKILEILIENDIEFERLLDQISMRTLRNDYIIPLLMSYNVDFITNKFYFQIARRLYEKIDNVRIHYPNYPEKLELSQQNLMNFLNYLLSDPRFDPNEVDRFRNKLTYYITYKPAVELLAKYMRV